MGIIPIVNENDSVATYDIEFGDNDRLSAVVAALVKADLLLLLSDIDGLYTDDPHKNPDAVFISEVDHLDSHFMKMAKGSTGSGFGTGGMATKLIAAEIATSTGSDMVIANADDFHVIHRIIEGEHVGTIFMNHPREEFYWVDYLQNMRHGE
jgi:glutamate 5-kinase